MFSFSSHPAARWGKGYIQMVWWINKHERSISNGVLCVIASPLSGTFKGYKIGMGFFGGLIFCPGIFWGFAGSPKDFFWSWLLAPFDHPRHLKSWIPPSLGVNSISPCYLFCHINFIKWTYSTFFQILQDKTHEHKCCCALRGKTMLFLILWELLGSEIIF